LDTSPAQFHRLLDQTNYKKSLDKLMSLLHVLDYEVDLVVKAKPSPAHDTAKHASNT